MAFYQSPLWKRVRWKELNAFFQDKYGPLAPDEAERTIEYEIPNWAILSAEELGISISLDYERRHKLGIRTIQCIDKTPKEATKENERRRRPKKNATAREKRAREKASRLPPLSARAIALNDVLRHAWLSANEISSALQNCKDFQYRGKRLDSKSLKSAIHRTLSELNAKRTDHVEQRLVEAPRGLKHRQVRLKLRP